MPEPLFIWQLREWPFFRWDSKRLAPLISRIRFIQGRLHGRMEGLAPERRRESEVEIRTEEIVDSRHLAGADEHRGAIRSAVANLLETGDPEPVSGDQRIDRLVRGLSDATIRYDEPLTLERICDWHRALFSGDAEVPGGILRRGKTGSPLDVTGPITYQAPPGERVQQEMARFERWFAREGGQDPLVKAALAHLGFMTIHPFPDGNGLLARAITEMQLARSEKSDSRYYSISDQIELDPDEYFQKLQQTQKGTLDVTDWLLWFLEMLSSAIERSDILLDDLLRRDTFWNQTSRAGLNNRQVQMLNRMLDDGVTGPVTSSAWAEETDVSQDTAGRDIRELVNRGILIKNPGGGRSTSYRLTGRTPQRPSE